MSGKTKYECTSPNFVAKTESYLDEYLEDPKLHDHDVKKGPQIHLLYPKNGTIERGKNACSSYEEDTKTTSSYGLLDPSLAIGSKSMSSIYT
jgi:hypothetical protein